MRAALKLRGQPQQVLCDVTGSDKASISRLLAEGHPAFSALVAPISDYLGIPYKARIAASEVHERYYALADELTSDQVEKLVALLESVTGKG